MRNPEHLPGYLSINELLLGFLQNLAAILHVTKNELYPCPDVEFVGSVVGPGVLNLRQQSFHVLRERVVGKADRTTNGSGVFLRIKIAI